MPPYTRLDVQPVMLVDGEGNPVSIGDGGTDTSRKESFMYLTEFGAKVGEDCTQAFKDAVVRAKETKVNTIVLPSGTLYLSETIDVPDNIVFVGQGVPRTSAVEGTKIVRTKDVVAFRIYGKSRHEIAPEQGHIIRAQWENILFHGGDYQSDFMQFIACSSLRILNCRFYACGGRAILGIEWFDSRVMYTDFDWCGNASGTLPAVELMSDITWEDGKPYEFTNQVHFFGCRFETYRGTAFKVSGNNTNEIIINSCKFESLRSIQPHLVFENAKMLVFRDVTVTSMGNQDPSTTLEYQIKFESCIGVFGSIYLEHVGSAGNTGAHISHFVDVEKSSYFHLFVYIFGNNRGTAQYPVMIDEDSNIPTIEIFGKVLGAQDQNISRASQRFRSIVITADGEPFLTFRRSDIPNERHHIGRLSNNNGRAVFKHVYGSPGEGESVIYEINPVTKDFKVRNKLLAVQGFGVGNSVTASEPGNVVRKIEVFDANGNSLGYIPVYDDIT